jgi:hypothetical protein
MITHEIRVDADLEDGTESFIEVQGLGSLTLAQARQLLADLDEEIVRAEGWQ